MESCGGFGSITNRNNLRVGPRPGHGPGIDAPLSTQWRLPQPPVRLRDRPETRHRVPGSRYPSYVLELVGEGGGFHINRDPLHILRAVPHHYFAANF